MLKEIETKYLEILKLLPKNQGQLYKLDSNGNKRLLIDMSAGWISLYYMKHHRSEKLREGYLIHKDTHDFFHVDLFQGWGEHGTKWESIVQHPDFHDNFWNIFNWAVSIIPEEARNIASEQKKAIRNRQRRQNRFIAKISSFDFSNYQQLIKLVTPYSLNYQKSFWEVFTEGFHQSNSFWNEEDDKYSKDLFFYFVMENLMKRGCAVWVDWKDIESCKHQISQLLTTHSISLSDNTFDVHNDIAEQKFALKKALQYLSHQLIEVDTNGDEFLFFLIRKEEKKDLLHVLSKLKEENFLPNIIKFQFN
ncbi:DUF6630 family protein [Vreelandella sp. GE22]